MTSTRHSKHTDYISDFTLHAKENALVSVSGDATLSVIDLNKRCHVARSEDDNDDELLSAAVLKGGRKLLAGSQSGVINLFSWGHFKDCSDRFPGHPESVRGYCQQLLRVQQLLDLRGITHKTGALPVAYRVQQGIASSNGTGLVSLL